MEQELSLIDAQMKEEIKNVKERYSKMKSDIKKKYKDLEKEKKKKEKEEQKKIRKSIPKSLKILVWDKNIGKEKGIGECNVCKSEIDSKNFECGHIISVKEGGDTNIENLLPICSSCNKSMGTENLMIFKERYFSKKSEKETKTPVEEFIDSKIKNNDSLIDEIISINDNYNIGGPQHDMFGTVEPQKMKTGRKVNRKIDLETIYNKYRKWLGENHPQIYKDTQFEGCFGGNDTMDNIKEIMTKKYGAPNDVVSVPFNSTKCKIEWCNLELL